MKHPVRCAGSRRRQARGTRALLLCSALPVRPPPPAGHLDSMLPSIDSRESAAACSGLCRRCWSRGFSVPPSLPPTHAWRSSQRPTHTHTLTRRGGVIIHHQSAHPQSDHTHTHTQAAAATTHARVRITDLSPSSPSLTGGGGSVRLIFRCSSRSSSTAVGTYSGGGGACCCCCCLLLGATGPGPCWPGGRPCLARPARVRRIRVLGETMV